MKRFLSLAVAVLVLASLSGCGKKSELEELQPITMESLSSTSTTTPISAEVKAAEVRALATGTMMVAKESLPLPPAGPYKPTGIEIQTALKNVGYYTGNIDGKIGPKSKKAIEDFQRANGLKVDGKVGPKTWEALSRSMVAAVETGKR